MNNHKVIPFLILLTATSIALAAGNHAGGHGLDSHASIETDSVHWMAPAVEAARSNPIALTAASVKEGAKLYQQYCSSCHGAKADGNGVLGTALMPKPANLNVMSGQHTDGDFAYKINYGRGAMPAWKKTLNEGQVWHLVNFIQSLSKKALVNKHGEHNHADEQEHDS